MPIATARIMTLSLASVLALGLSTLASAQERLPWGSSERSEVVTPDSGATDRYDEPRGYDRQRSYDPPRRSYNGYDDRASSADRPYGGAAYGSGQSRPYAGTRDDAYRPPRSDSGYGRPYEPPPRGEVYRSDRQAPRDYDAEAEVPPDRTYSPGEIRDAGHRFFGKVSSGLASVIEYAFQKAGRPSGYILGEEAGGAFIAGLRYGEGILHLKDGTRRKVFWQGPSVGYDFGADGSKTMILVYNLYHPEEIYHTFGGIDGSAYLVGGVGITFQKHDHVTLAPIRSGLGLRLGANVGYLKYTRRPTWLPF